MMIIRAKTYKQFVEKVTTIHNKGRDDLRVWFGNGRTECFPNNVLTYMRTENEGQCYSFRVDKSIFPLHSQVQGVKRTKRIADNEIEFVWKTS